MKRTKKIFHNYNDYHDRGMMKWQTAFAMDELVKGIKQNEAEAGKDIPTLPQMSAEEISSVLQQAFLTRQPVAVQLNEKDALGRQTEALRGSFNGQQTPEKLLIGTVWLSWDDIRHIQLLPAEKWFQRQPLNDENT